MTSRTITGIFRLCAAAALAVALGYQVVDKVTHNDMVASEYFSFFTIQSAIIAIVVLGWGGVVALRHALDSSFHSTARMCVLAYAIVTAGVYNVVLRGIPSDGYAAVPWPGEIMHVWVPVVLLIDWIIAPARPGLPWRSLRVVVVYPILWLVYTFLRGAITGWFPYPFLEPSTGWLSVFGYILAITVFILGAASLAIGYSRRRAR